MIFIFKKRKIVLDCFTAVPSVFETAKIKKSSNFFPQWWKTLPKSVPVDGSLQPQPTMKGCVGFTEQFSHGVTVPLWSDLAVEVEPVGSPYFRWEFSDKVTTADTHPPHQRGDYLPPTEYVHLKINTPWRVKCKEEVPFQFIQSQWNFNDPRWCLIPPGIVEFKYQNSININCLFVRDSVSRMHLLEHGQPMIQLIPLDQRDIDVKCHFVTLSEMERIDNTTGMISFNGKYRKYKKALKNNGFTGGSCPFHKLKGE